MNILKTGKFNKLICLNISTSKEVRAVSGFKELNDSLNQRLSKLLQRTGWFPQDLSTYLSKYMHPCFVLYHSISYCFGKCNTLFHFVPLP